MTPPENEYSWELGFYVPPASAETPLLLERLAAAGIRHIAADGMRDDMAAERLFASLVERHGLSLVAMHGTDPLVPRPGQASDELVPGLLRTVERARRWGCPCVVLHFRHVALPWRWGVRHEADDALLRMGLDRADRLAAEVLAPALEAADLAAVGLALENVGPGTVYAARVTDVRAFVERVGSPHLRLCVDTGHAHCVGLDAASEVLCAGNLLVTTHINDNVGPADPTEPPELVLGRDQHRIPGLGTINWVAVIRALHQVDYRGPILFEGVLRVPQRTGAAAASPPGATDVADLDEQIWLTMHAWKALERLASSPS